MDDIIQNAQRLDWILLAIAVIGIVLWVMNAVKKDFAPDWLGTVKFATVVSIVILAIRQSDFEILLVVAAAFTFVCWLLDKVVFRAVRVQDPETKMTTKVKPQRPEIVEHAAGFFFVILIVLVLRSFVFEPFRIPSESMVPTLQNGDFVVVSKFAYGVRLPITNQKIIEVGRPDRGDVVVFRYPQKPEIDFIKRIIGLPGDKIGMQDNQLYVNGIPATYTNQQAFTAYAVDSCGETLLESIPREDGAKQLHTILDDTNNCSKKAGVMPSGFSEIMVPDGHFLVMGDNRQHSSDSRRWGFLPEANLAGKATYIWFNWRFWDHTPQFSRIGNEL